MNYFLVEPEVAGGLGPRTKLDRSTHPPLVTRLHYEFDGWLGDVLLESFPCFVVTKGAEQQMQTAGLTGISFSPVEVSSSEQFHDLYPERRLPEFAWLRVTGKPFADDFGLDPLAHLVVSERALTLLKSLGIEHAVTSPAGPKP